MKKYFMGVLAVIFALALCACSPDPNSGNSAVSEAEKSEQIISEEPKKNEIAEEPKKDQISEEPKKDEIEQVQGEVKEEETSEETPEEDPVLDETEEQSPGADVVELVNLRGDTTTVYKLVDGTYLDRIERHFVYDGIETWTDEDGVEWNEVVK